MAFGQTFDNEQYTSVENVLSKHKTKRISK